MKTKSPGFTLVEIMVVVTIIGLLLSVMLPGMKYAMNRVRRFATDQIMSKVEFALTQYNLDHSSYPGKREGYLNALVTRPQSIDPADYKGPYYPSDKIARDEFGNFIVNDQWGKPLEYNNPPVHNRKYRNYELISYGGDENNPDGYIVRGN